MELHALLQSLQVLMPDAEREQQKQRLEEYINFLIQKDFGRLVQLLYNVDVDEQTVKQLLLQQPEKDAAQIITGLLISRQEEKAQSRQQFRQNNPDDDEDRW